LKKSLKTDYINPIKKEEGRELQPAPEQPRFFKSTIMASRIN